MTLLTSPFTTMIDDNAILATFQEVACARKWSHLHTPRNLASAISVEAAELLEIHQWQTLDAQLTAVEREKAESEVADLVMYILAYCDAASIDLNRALEHKAAVNRLRFLQEAISGPTG